ncbi:hypothetical protein, partial [Yersinia intermedia]|uniref:hypothetical protein n=1 Tax=Yersinia intermedia TaxID=631 RepID=UPI001C8F902C
AFTGRLPATPMTLGILCFILEAQGCWLISTKKSGGDHQDARQRYASVMSAHTSGNVLQEFP